MGTAELNGAFAWPVRVYYEDTDAGGVVYHARYLYFLERARTEWLRSLGFEQDLLRDQLHCLFVVRSLSAHFKKPALFNDLLQVYSTVKPIKNTRLQFSQTIKRHQHGLFEAQVEVVCVDSHNFRPRSIPPVIIAAIPVSF